MNLKQVTGKSRISDGRFKAFSQRQQDELDEEWNWFVNSESSYKGGEEIAKELRNLLETAQSQEDISAIRKKRGSLLSYCGKYIDRSYFKSLDSRLAAEKYLSEIYMSEEDYQNMLNEARQRVYSNVSDSRRIKDDSESVFQEFVNFLGEVEDESKDNSSMQPVMIHITRNHYNQNYVDVDFEILASPAKFDLIMCSSVSLYGNDLKGVVNELLIDMDTQIKDIARRDYGVAEMVASEIGCTPEEVLDNDVEFCGAFIPVKDYIAQKIKSNISDSRRVKDEYTEPFWYSFGGAFDDPYNIDREVEDEDFDTACYLMDKTDEIKDKYLPNDKAYNDDVEGWVNAFHEIIKLLERTPMENPESVYEYLESDNYHDIYSLMFLMGLCGDEWQKSEVRFIKERKGSSYRPCWYEAEDIIAEEMGLL